jgi:hypothetical protein
MTAREHLDSRLLGMLLCHPGPYRILQLAVGTGLAIAYHLREDVPTLDLLMRSQESCDAACDAVLRFWVARSRIGDVSESDFQTLIAEVIRVARAS